MTDEQKAFLEALNTLLQAEYTDTVTVQTDTSQVVPIKIIISNKPTISNQPTFYATLLDKAEAIPAMVKLLSLRVASSKPHKRRVATDNFTMPNLIEHLHQVDMISEGTDDIDTFKDKATNKLTHPQFARLIEHVMVTWQSAGKALRQPTKFNEKMFRGYLKLRKQYTHDEIIEGIQVYIRWAKAYLKAKDDDVQFWFYRWTLDKFLVSETAMSNVDGGWEDVVLSKKIPPEYASTDGKKTKYRGMFQD